jgi:hypothetical protein
MKQIKISKPYLNPMKKFNLENKCKDETEIQQLRNEKSHIKDYVSYEKVTNVKWLIPVLFGEAKEEYQEDWMKEYAAEIVEKIKKEKDKKDFSLCYYGDSGYILITKGSNIIEM